MEAGEQVAGGYTECTEKRGAPLKPESNLFQKNLPLQVNVKVTETLLKNMDRFANLSTNGKPGKFNERDPE